MNWLAFKISSIFTNTWSRHLISVSDWFIRNSSKLHTVTFSEVATWSLPLALHWTQVKVASISWIGMLCQTTQWQAVCASWAGGTGTLVWPIHCFESTCSVLAGLGWICIFSGSHFHQQAPLCWHLHLILQPCLLTTKWLLIVTASQVADKETEITELTRDEGILNGIWQELKDQHWWIICVIWIICGIMHRAVVFSSIRASIVFTLQSMRVTIGELWNFNKLRCPTHLCSFADFPLPLKSFHHSYSLRYFISELRTHFPWAQYVSPSFSIMMPPTHEMALDSTQLAQ